MADPLNHRALRDAIEQQLAALPWLTRGRSLRLDTADGRTVAAGVLRKAIGPQLAEHQETRDTLNRVREVLRQHQGDDTIPRRQIEAALYGDEEYRRG